MCTEQEMIVGGARFGVSGQNYLLSCLHTFKYQYGLVTDVLLFVECVVNQCFAY